MFLIIGCSKQPIINDNNTVLFINPQESEKMDLSDFIDSICIIPLETADNSLIKRSVNLKIVNHQYFINDSREQLLVFDECGNYLYSSKKKAGNGPNEYLTLMDFDIINDKIEIFDALGYKMRVYNEDMDYVEEFILNRDILPAERYFKLNDDLYVFQESDKTGFNLKLYSKKRNEILEKIEVSSSVSDEKKQFVGVTPHPFLAYNGKYYATSFFPSNELYEFDPISLKLSLVLRTDFGKYNFSIEQMSSSVNSSVDYLKDNSDKFAFVGAKYLLPHHKLVFFSYGKIHPLHLAYFSEKANSVKVYYNEPYSKEQMPIPDLVENNYLYYVCEPQYLSYHVDTMLMVKKDILKMKIINEDDNPIIIRYKLKEK